MKKLDLIIIVIILCSFSVTAQNKTTKKGDNHFAKFEFVEAIVCYNKLVEKGSANTYIYSQLAEANYNIFNTIEAEKWFAKTLETLIEPEIVFKYSEMLKANGKFELAKTQMEKFASIKPNDTRAKLFMANPNYLPKILKKGNKFTIKNLAVNSEFSDFGGTVKNGKLYITSARNNAKKSYSWNKQPFLDIYKYTITANNNYKEEAILKSNINTKYHEGLIAFSPNSNVVYFSRESFFDDIYSQKEGSTTKYSVLHMFKGIKNSTGFSSIKALAINNKNYSIKNPSVSPDGKSLYFASDMPGGFGLFDIYKASISSKGVIGKPVNMGEEINTKSQEMFPFISTKNILYFSSNGHLGLGGMDVFYTKIGNNKVAPIRNIGIPINSNADDFAFLINEDTKEGFVSSNRKGGKGDDDIYAIIKTQPLCDVVIKVTVIDKKTGIPIDDATAILIDGKGNILSKQAPNTKGEVTYLIECDTDTELQVASKNYKNSTRTITASNKEELKVTIALEPIEKIIIPKEEIVLNPIYFDFDKSNITAKAAFELDNIVQIMTKYPDLIIYATSHTDIRGSDNYNIALSNRRAKTTIQYIISKGIDSYRISAAGKGEFELLIDCNNTCTKQEHQLNRRSQFKIISGGPNSTN